MMSVYPPTPAIRPAQTHLGPLNALALMDICF